MYYLLWLTLQKLGDLYLQMDLMLAPQSLGCLSCCHSSLIGIMCPAPHLPRESTEVLRILSVCAHSSHKISCILRIGVCLHSCCLKWVELSTHPIWAGGACHCQHPILVDKTVKNCEGPENSASLQATKVACHSFTDAGRRSIRVRVHPGETRAEVPKDGWT